MTLTKAEKGASSRTSNSFSKELCRYAKLIKQLRLIWRDTKAFFHDLGNVGRIDWHAEYAVKSSFSSEEAEEIERWINSSVQILVFGRNSAKATLVNCILNEELMPTKHKVVSGSWPSLFIKYGDQARVAFADGEVQDFDGSMDKLLSGNCQQQVDLALSSKLLKEGLSVFVQSGDLSQVELTSLSILFFAVRGSLSEQEVSQLTNFSALNPQVSILFVYDSVNSESDSRNEADQANVPGSATIEMCKTQLESLGLINVAAQQLSDLCYALPSQLVALKDLASIVHFFKSGLRASLLRTASFLKLIHSRSLQIFMQSAFSMARDMQLTPRRLEYARVQEVKLFEKLLVVARNKQAEMQQIIAKCLVECRSEILDKVSEYQFIGVDISSSGKCSSYDLRICIGQLQQLVLGILNRLVSHKLLHSINVLHDSYSGVLTRCLLSLENVSMHHCNESEGQSSSPCPNGRSSSSSATDLAHSSSKSFPYSSDVQKKSLPAAEESVMQSSSEPEEDPSDFCLSSDAPLLLPLRREFDEQPCNTSCALKQILNSAYCIEMTLTGGSSLLHLVLQRMKQLVHSLPWVARPQVDAEWRQQFAQMILDSLDAERLARSVNARIQDRLRQAHGRFELGLAQLAATHSLRLRRTEEQALRLRKVNTPRLARLSLEAVCVRDRALYDMPEVGPEIGRGQYGVVYSCKHWRNCSGNWAIKSVVPLDDKHWNDLAMELYYCRNLVPHERIAMIHASLIDYDYGGGASPAVLLVMDRFCRDFHAAIKLGLPWSVRLRVCIDVVQGIRFLHSQGLIHRDIKLKNILLDDQNQGRITDLGFCKPEAMVSGSIVGTPLHMAPELFSGSYDHSVDIYAFAILFWYACAGHVHTPSHFDICETKDVLWNSVRKGVRPERLPQFPLDCWELMQWCWNGNPKKRPLPGEVEQALLAIEHGVNSVDESPQ